MANLGFFFPFPSSLPVVPTVCQGFCVQMPLGVCQNRGNILRYTVKPQLREYLDFFGVNLCYKIPSSDRLIINIACFQLALPEMYI